MIDINDLAAPTVGEATYQRLREDIIACRLAPRQKLKLEALRERYDTGVSTLREILNRLASESLVIAEGQKGFAVAPATRQDLREIADLRLLLESHALRLSLSTGDLDWEGRVVAAQHKLAVVETQLLQGDMDRTLQWVHYDFAFHNALISACGSQTLLALHASVFDRFIRYHLLAATFRGAPVMDDHRALFELAMQREIEPCVIRLASHIKAGVDHVLGSGRF